MLGLGLTKVGVGLPAPTSVFEVMFRVMVMDDDVDVQLAPHDRSSENS